MLVDEIADAHRVTGANTTASTVRQANFAVGIAQQTERQAVLRSKSSIRGDVVEANAQNLDPFAFESTVLVAEPATLSGSASCIGLGIEPQQNLAATQ
jgi:protein required for attachment to host cells